MEFTCGNTKIHLSFWFFEVLCVYILCDASGAGLPILCAVVCHEAGHLAMLRLTGGRISRMTLSPFGVRLEKANIMSISAEMLVYAGGALMNAACILLCLLFRRFPVFLQANVTMILFNLLPVGRLDGGVLLRLFLEKRMEIDRVESIQCIVGFLVLAPLFALAFLMLREGNATLLLTAAYLSYFLLHT